MENRGKKSYFGAKLYNIPAQAFNFYQDVVSCLFLCNCIIFRKQKSQPSKKNLITRLDQLLLTTLIVSQK